MIMKNRIISYLLVCIIMFSYIPVSSAQEKNLEVPITVSEKNGISVSGVLQRRGVPFKEGQVFEGKDLVMEDASGKTVPFVAEPMQYYDDGSVKWMRCSFSPDLKPYEIKGLYIKNGNDNDRGNVSLKENADSIEMTNGIISLRLGYRGIESIKIGSKELLPETGLNIYAVTNGNKNKMKGVELEVIKDTDLYAKASVSGRITDTLRGEICVTLSHESDRIDIEYRLNSRKDEVISSTGMTMEHSSEIIGTVSEDCFKLDDIAFISTDNTKFRGAVSKKDDTGFILDGQNVSISPIVNNTSFNWYDGVTRTNHLYIVPNEKLEDSYKTVLSPPEVRISAEQFMESGIISSAQLPAPAQRLMNALHWASDRLDGRFEAGSIPYDINVDSNICSSFGTRNGETEFYLSYGYMMSEDPLLYEMITDSAESWADVVIYKGGKKEIYGANRYRTGETYGGERFFTSHPYYGDLSGLYMAYIISGNEYLERVFKDAIDYMYKNMYVRTNSGKYYPRRTLWNGERVTYATEAESRYLIQTRGFYLAYQLYRDEKYKEAANGIISWAKKTQTDRGFWYQAYHDDGRAYVQGTQLMPAAKNYIYLYGIRGILEMFEYEQTDEIKEVIENCADFLCYENETFGPGIWHPFGDAKEYEVNENDTRGKSPMSDIMAVDVLYCAYKETGNERYFKNMLSLLDIWICAQTPGGSVAHQIGKKGYSPQINNTVGQNLTFLRRCSEIGKLIEENYDYVVSQGFEDLVVVFGRNSQNYKADIQVEKYSYPEIIVKGYESDNGTVILGMNVTGSTSGDYEKDINIIVNDQGLWQGIENKISTPYTVELQQKSEQYDLIRAIKRPVYVTELLTEFKAQITEYTSQKVEITLYSDAVAAFSIKNGLFEIKSGQGYNVNKNGNVITVTKGGNAIANSNGELEFCVGADSKNEISNMWLKNNGINSISELPTGKELNIFTRSVFGENIFPDLDSPLKNEDAYGAVVEKLAKEQELKLKAMGVWGTEITVPALPENDEEAVKIAAGELEVKYDGEMLASDVELLKEFIYDTKISWTSSNEAVLSNEGVLDRNKIDSETVTLTAHISKNAAKAEKEFVIPLKPKEEMKWRTKVAFNDCKFSIIPQKENFEMSFTVIPDKEKVNALVGITEGALGVSAMSQLAVIVRFNPDGYIDAYNKTTYTAENSIPYFGGKKYSFKMVVRPQAQEFDAYVTDESGVEYIIGKNYGFRLSAPSPGVFDTVYIPAAIEDNCFSMLDNSLAQYAKDSKPEFYEKTSELGLKYGRFAAGKIYLPPVNDNKKQSWITQKRGMINEFNILSGGGDSGTTMLYCVEDSEVKSITDVAKHLKLTDGADKEAYITGREAALLLRRINYYE